MSNDLYFMVRDLQKWVDPVAHYVDFFSRNTGTPKHAKDAIKVFKKYNELKNVPDGWLHYADTSNSLEKLKDILDTRYPIEKFPEYYL